MKKNNKTILLIGYDDITDPKSWSGTPFHVIQEFRLKGFIVYTLDASLWKRNIIGKIIYKIIIYIPLIGRWFYSHLFQLVYRIYIKYKFKQYKLDYETPVIFLGNCINLKSNSIKSYLYCDAIHHIRENYYPFDKCHNESIKKIKKYFIYNTEDEMCKSMTHIFTQSEWVRNYLVNELFLSTNVVTNVGFGLDIQLLKHEKSYDNNLLLIILRKGNEKLKGLYLLLEAFRKVKKNIPDVELAVVGTQLERQCGVMYYYNKPRSVTVDLLKKATLYVMPALNEPNGQTYLEALANKTPIVGLNRFAFPEFCGYGKYGYICEKENPDELADLLITALKDKKLLREKADAGYKYVKTLPYNWETIVDTFIKTIY